ncbi:PAAR domain-containing protein [Actinomycetes bacterium KLBMP 9797]
MTQPVARQNDPVVAQDTHIVLTPSTVSVLLPFTGQLVTKLSPDVLVNGLPAATVDSIAQNMPPHIPPPGSSFSKPPTNLGRVVAGAPEVLVNGQQLARVGDPVETCNDPKDLPVGKITAGSPDVIA